MSEIVNRMLRRGFKASRTQEQRERYRCPSFQLGHPPRYNLDHSLDIAEQVELEEIARKIAVRK